MTKKLTYRKDSRVKVFFKKHWKIICIAALAAILLYIVYIAIDPVHKAGRDWKTKYSQIADKKMIFHLTDDMIYMGMGNIGYAITKTPMWITEGLNEARSGEHSEKALFASRYNTEKVFVEFRYNYLDPHNGASFNRWKEWRIAVFTLGDALYTHPEDFTEEQQNKLRETLAWLLL